MKNNDIREFARKMEGKKLTILGHENIDVDAFLSGVLLSRLFDFLKIDNEFIVLEEVAEGNEQLRVNKSHRGIVIHTNGGIINITFNEKGGKP